MSNQQRLHLHIPEPAARPGMDVDFSTMTLPAAGETRRPDALGKEEDMRDMPFGLVRVLDDNGNAIGPWVPRISPERLREGLRAMMLTRIFDDRMYRLQRQGKTSFYMKSTGEEAIGAAPSLVLEDSDMCFPTYRVTSWLHARKYPLVKLLNQIFSNAEDPLRGRQLPVLYSARDYGFYSISGNLGNRFGHAVGWAMASAYEGDSKIALAYTGDGSTAEGNFHEALTFASVYHAPCLLCISNNQWAISSFAGIAGGDETTFAAKGLAYGIPGLRVDGNDFLAVWSATEWAVERAKANLGATLIEFFTYRVAPHSSSDDPTKYRPAQEASAWPLGDPITRLKQHLIKLGEWDEARDEALTAELEAEVKEAVRQAEAIGSLGQSKPPVKEMFECVFKEPDWRVLEQRRELGV